MQKPNFFYFPVLLPSATIPFLHASDLCSKTDMLLISRKTCVHWSISCQIKHPDFLLIPLTRYLCKENWMKLPRSSHTAFTSLSGTIILHRKNNLFLVRKNRHGIHTCFYQSIDEWMTDNLIGRQQFYALFDNVRCPEINSLFFSQEQLSRWSL